MRDVTSRPGRLSRRGRRYTWLAVPVLATDFAASMAGETVAGLGPKINGGLEIVWRSPGLGELVGETQLHWIVPGRTHERAMAVYHAAVDAATRAGVQPVVVVRRWSRTGRWRRVAARRWPEHTGKRPGYPRPLPP